MQHYYNKGHTPTILDPSNPSVGISGQNYALNQGAFTCSFKRDIKKDASLPNYFDLSKQFYALSAKGPLKISINNFIQN